MAHAQQTAVIVVAVPGKQRRVFSQQLLQTFDIVVVNHASSLCCCPLETVAEPFALASAVEVLPTGVARSSDARSRVAHCAA